MGNIEKQLRLNRIVEYIKQQEFLFDIHDVENNLTGILDHFGIDELLDNHDFLVLKDELLKLAEDAQTEEIIRILRDSEVIL